MAMEIDKQLRLEEIQGNITPGFRKDFQELVFVRFPDQDSGRAWVDALYPDITSAWEVATYNRLYYAVRHPPDFGKRAGDGWPIPPREGRRDFARVLRSTWLNVAFTAAGLKQFYSDLSQLKLSFAFRSGLFNHTTIAESEFVFGPKKDDWQVRDSARRDPPGPPDDPRIAHAVLIVGADTATDLDVELKRQYWLLATHRVDLVTNFRGQTLGDGRVHFGYRDGLSQPDPSDPLDAWGVKDPEKVDDPEFFQEQIVAPGEFILGSPNERGETPDEVEWARNGSYLVFMKLAQDVKLFHEVMQEQVQHLKADGLDYMSEELLAAKALGRWPSGAPIVNGAREDPRPVRQPLGQELWIRAADFDQDADGDGCPLFSHVRKANPRIHELDDRGNADRVHRIIRRGIPYGPVYVPGADDAQEERGLLFLGYQASIDHQFEHIMVDWFGSEKFPNADPLTGCDPFIGTDAARHETEQAAFDVSFHLEGQSPSTVATATFTRFISAKGGGYFFAPSIPALAALAQDQVHA